MPVYDLNGNRLAGQNVFMGVIMSTDTDEKRFTAMKQLFDIAIKKIKKPDYIPQSGEFTDAASGMVCLYPDLSANLCEGYSPKILYEKNKDTVYSTMSTGKIMTILAGLPYISNICYETVTLSPDDITTGSGNYFEAGDILTVEDLIYGAMLPSSNTCAAAYAHYVGKKILHNENATFSECMNAFYAEMNRRAGILGCVNSTFVSASGLDINNVSTPADLMKILQACTIHPELTTIWNKKSYAVNIKGENPRVQNISTTVTHSELENKYYILGGKTGSSNSGNRKALVMIATPK